MKDFNRRLAKLEASAPPAVGSGDGWERAVAEVRKLLPTTAATVLAEHGIELRNRITDNPAAIMGHTLRWLYRYGGDEFQASVTALELAAIQDDLNREWHGGDEQVSYSGNLRVVHDPNFYGNEDDVKRAPSDEPTT